jgi:tryptophan synthase alpha chain
MNRYQKTFERLAGLKEMAFIPFAVAGDPDIDMSEKVLKTYVDGGADILEIGYPFSDPMADGPVNQRAAQRAIASGIDHRSFFSLVKRIRAYTDIPIGVLIYANSIYHTGHEQFCRMASDAGIDSLLVADLPPEEAGPLKEAMAKYGIGSVFIVSELTPKERMRYICNAVDSFVYVVSRLGTTGTGEDLGSAVGSTLKQLHRITQKPLAVGFGVSNPSHVIQLKKCKADAAIVGSALVKIIEENLNSRDRIPTLIKKAVTGLKAATR